MTKIGIASINITPQHPVWLTGYGNRDHKSEGVYQSLTAGAISIAGDTDEVLILTADLIGYDLAYAAAAKNRIAESTGLLPRQVVLTATHTHCAPLFYPMAMPGEVEKGYAEFLLNQLVQVTVSAKNKQVEGAVAFSRGRSEFGVSRRLPDGKGGVQFAPNPDGPMDRDLDTLWFSNVSGETDRQPDNLWLPPNKSRRVYAWWGLPRFSVPRVDRTDPSTVILRNRLCGKHSSVV